MTKNVTYNHLPQNLLRNNREEKDDPNYLKDFLKFLESFVKFSIILGRL